MLQVEQLDAVEATNACGVARPWTGQILHCKDESVPDSEWQRKDTQ